MALLLFIGTWAICPRIVMFLIWMSTDWFDKAFETGMWPFLGFMFMPNTTLVYMDAAMNNNGEFTGFRLFLLVLAILLDITSDSASASKMKNGDKSDSDEG